MAENKDDKNNKERKKLKIKELETDVLIIGGGTAGCYAAITIGKNSDLSVIVAEKANIKRSGCLAFIREFPSQWRSFGSSSPCRGRQLCFQTHAGS